MALRYLAVTFLQDTVLGLFTFAAGLQCSLPEDQARGLSPQYVSISGPGSADARLSIADIGSGEFDTLQTEIDTLTGTVAGISTTVDNLTGEVSDLSSSFGTLSMSFDALSSNVTTLSTSVSTLTSTVGGITTSVNLLLAGSNYEETIVGLVDGGIVDNWATFQGYLGPAELNGSILTGTDGVMSFVPDAGNYRVSKRIDIDPQISMDWTGRGAIVIVPDAHIQGIVEGAAGTGVRTGGGGPNSVFRSVRRAGAIGRQAYEQMIGGFNLDGSGVNTFDNFTVDVTGTITSAAHGRVNGDMIFFDQAADGTALPAPLALADFTIATAFYAVNCTTNTFQVSATLGGSPIATAAGKGVWTMNFYGFRTPNNQPTKMGMVANGNDPDQDWDSRKNYTGGSIRDMDIVKMPASGLYWEAGNGRVHLHSVRALNNRIHGLHIDSNDTILSGHWAVGGNGGFGLRKGAASGLYAWGGNAWGAPASRSVNCGAIWLRDSAWWVIGGTEFNDWARFDGNKNFNNGGALVGNMVHPHAENFSEDGVAINVRNDNDSRLQATFGFAGYQGPVVTGNAWSRTEKVSFNTPLNFGGVTDGTTGTAPLWLIDVGGTATGGSTTAMIEIFDGVCSAPDTKPWTGPFIKNCVISAGILTWASHPLLYGDRVRFHNGTLTNITPDTTDYYVIPIDANTAALTATYGGATLTAASGFGATICQVSSCPYNFHNGGRAAGVFVDSFRGVVNLWARGTAPKFQIGTSANVSWEGNPAYAGEIGNQSSTPKRYALYGTWELDNAIGYQDAANGSHMFGATPFAQTIKAGTRQYTIHLTMATSYTGTITLPTGVDISYSQPLRVIVYGKAAQFTWAFSQGGSWYAGTVPPTAITNTGTLVVELWYSHLDGQWMYLSSQGGLAWATAGAVSGSIATDLSVARNYFVGPITGSTTIANPTNPADGVDYTWMVTQDGTGGHTIALDTKFAKSVLTFSPDTTASTSTLIRAKYSSANDRFYVTDFQTKVA